MSRIRTGYETAISHLTSDEFSYTAKDDGRVIEIDPKLKIVKIQYADKDIETGGKISLPLPSTEISHRFESHQQVGLIVGSEELKNFPIGKYFQVTSKIYAQVAHIERASSFDAIPDMIARRAAARLEKDLESGHRDSVCYIVFDLKPSTTSGEIDVITFGDDYSVAAGSYLKQTTIVNVIAGQSVKQGDIIAYNSGFFKPIPGTTQVAWKHGLNATVALIETSDTLEDGCIISEDFGQKLTMSPAHVRPLEITHDTVLSDIVPVGTELETTDPLCTLLDGDLADYTSPEEVNESFFGSFAEKPKAKSHGTLERIEVFYACPFHDLSESLQKLVTLTTKHHKGVEKAIAGTLKEGKIHGPGQVPVGLKYHGTDFQPGVVLVEFTIAETIPTAQGDKICLMNANKSVVSSVSKKPAVTESGVVVDIIYATTSIYNRIVNSPIVVGMTNRVLEALEKKIVSMNKK